MNKLEQALREFVKVAKERSYTPVFEDLGPLVIEAEEALASAAQVEPVATDIETMEREPSTIVRFVYIDKQGRRVTKFIECNDDDQADKLRALLHPAPSMQELAAEVRANYDMGRYTHVCADTIEEIVKLIESKGVKPCKPY